MRPYAYATSDGSGPGVYLSSALPRVLDRYEFERMADPRRNAAPDDRRLRVVDGGRAVEDRTRLLGCDDAASDRSSEPHGRPTALTVLRIALGVVVLAGLLVLLFIPGAEADRGPAPTVSHVVQPGDSLWSLAARYTPPEGDVRQTIALIRDNNGGLSDLLMPGTLIEMPAEEIPGWRPGDGDS